MPPDRPAPREFDPERYSDTDARLFRWKTDLPEPALTSMAREVIVRLADFRAADSSGDGRISALTAALIDRDRDLCRNMVEDLLDEGVPVETLYLVYLAGAARKLGQKWEEDALSFADVAVGTGRIYALLRALNAPASSNWADSHPGAFFAALPGEEHVLGVRMAADLFRRRGWQIDLVLGLDHDATVSAFVEGSHRLVGLSGATERDIPALGRMLAALRAVRPGVKVMVAGQIANTAPEAVAALAPDAVAGDFESAFTDLTGLWSDLDPARR